MCRHLLLTSTCNHFNWFLIDCKYFRDATSIVAEIINTIGQASAHAQGLNTAVTNAERIRNSEDQVIYIMTEENDKK